MTEVLQANIFFYIASAATILFTIFICVLLYHIIRIVKAIRRIVARVDAGSEVLASDIEELRSNFNLTRLLGFVAKVVPTMRGDKRSDAGDGK